jgi:GTP-binding protein
MAKAKFICSYTDVKKMPTYNKPEYAFIGRSNVGKSSLINLLTEQKELAKTSSKPGKTQLINVFEFDEMWYLIDLPGYGYAKTSQKNREKWHDMVKSYLRNRENLTNVFVLIDARISPMKSDIEQIVWLAENGIPFSIVYTKIDKPTSKELSTHIKEWHHILGESWEELPVQFKTSSEKGLGKTDLIQYIEDINQNLG